MFLLLFAILFGIAKKNAIYVFVVMFVWDPAKQNVFLLLLLFSFFQMFTKVVKDY